ncbi:SigE family RNA polymerase sigma factor [Jiangella muralis]|uniref:SigE family RNA polymerase sigma factor n=1 Tax=Jiangella muralis TaxID=702383 RepID=UPI001F0B3390|nr:SigE family RNA polymerase sigma factor [Jiangella muralis]
MSRRHARADEFVAYVDARRGYLRRVAYLVCGDWHAAEDLVQTALIKLYAAWPRIHTDGAEDAYVRRIIVRAHLDEKRRPWRRERIGLDGIDAAAPETLSLEDSDALIGALKALPQRQRATVVLRYWCGLSVEETADDLGCTTGTVKSQTARAMAGLRASLSTDDVTTTERRSR